tara:strand:+ start:524 stop:781 length:258 start_codon:yes stop_codon:yes gene_type:complete
MSISVNTGIVFIPKIPDHLIKTKGTPEAYSKEELAKVIDLRASGLSYRECGVEMARGGGSIACAITYHKLNDAIKEKRESLEASL